MDKEQLQQLAQQLGRPSGEFGIKVAENMSISNAGMTRNSILNLELEKNDKVLELGHGNGSHLGELFSQASNIHYHGLEISELMHNEAEVNSRELSVNENSFFHLYNGKIIPFDDNSFDKIFTVNTLYFWPEPVKMLNEILRVLKPGGRFSLTFAEKSFMEKLPFTEFFPTLYHLEEAENLVRKTDFILTEADRQTEEIIGNHGETLVRDYVTLKLRKKN